MPVETLLGAIIEFLGDMLFEAIPEILATFWRDLTGDKKE